MRKKSKKSKKSKNKKKIVLSGSGCSSMDVPGKDLTMDMQKLMDLAAQPYTDKEEEAYELYRRILRAVEEDDSDEFYCLIDSPVLQHLPPPWYVSDIGSVILRVGAVKCADIVLWNETGGIINKHFGFSRRHGWTAFHEACLGPHVAMLQKLLDTGYFSPDLRADVPVRNDLPLKQALPLNVGLNTFRIALIRIPDLEPSAISLLQYFYTKMDDDLDAIRLLALNTREFKEEFLNYAKQGKMPEVAALLLAAGDKLLPIHISEGGDEHKFNSFKELCVFLQKNNKGWSSTISNDGEFAEWKESLKLLDIYDKIGYQLTADAGLKKCRRSGMGVQDLLKAQCFDVESCSRHHSTPKEVPLFMMNRKPKQSHLGVGTMGFHWRSKNNYSTSAANTRPMKWLTAIQNHNSNNSWLPFLRILSKRVRRV